MARNSDRLLAAAMTTLAQTPQASLEQIAEAAGVARTTLFRHFRTRQELLRALAEEAVRQCTEAAAPSLGSALPPDEKLRRAVKALIPLGAALRFLSYQPCRSADPELERINAGYLEPWKSIVPELKHAGFLAPAIPLPWAVALLDMLIFGAWEAIHHGDLAPNCAAELVVRTFFRGVGA